MRIRYATRHVGLGLLLAVVGAVGYADDIRYIPDRELSPGAVNPDVNQDNVWETVCVSGWTSTIRPSSSYISRLEKKQLELLGLPGSPRDYHMDHLVPLCAGGHPSDPRNLWPQPTSGKWTDKVKDQLESSVCRQLCRGAISLQEAQAIFLAPDWTRSYTEYFELK